MTTELEATGFDGVEATTLTREVDAMALIEGLTDAELDRLQVRLNQRRNVRIKAAAEERAAEGRGGQAREPDSGGEGAAVRHEPRRAGVSLQGRRRVLRGRCLLGGRRPRGVDGGRRRTPRTAGNAARGTRCA